MERIGVASTYTPGYVTHGELDALLQFAQTQKLTVYEYVTETGKVVKVARAPKMEFYISTDNGRKSGVEYEIGEWL